jgi:hypothetical protein
MLSLTLTNRRKCQLLATHAVPKGRWGVSRPLAEGSQRARPVSTAHAAAGACESRDQTRDVRALPAWLAVERRRIVNGGSVQVGLRTAVPGAVRLEKTRRALGRRAAAASDAVDPRCWGMKFCIAADVELCLAGQSVSGGDRVNCGLCVALGQTGAVFARSRGTGTALIKLLCTYVPADPLAARSLGVGDRQQQKRIVLGRPRVRPNDLPYR